MNSRDFVAIEDNGSFKATKNNNYWIVEKGAMLVTGTFEGRELLEFTSRPIQTKSALVDWILRVYF
ncbi:MAG: hypothetical protein ACRCT7_17260 [Shewanella sp.]|uniref:hypothetical protein n=1 Tax=Shewanella sp. SNU WT4 TaxID=2590015 RepID=UPI00112A5286|nr:hypothetical protein [Shewanella sp. SNU WT4]QDF68675.1 hypothetical protein FJQ87_18355 [Shewanella sp. SNU WT4]